MVQRRLTTGSGCRFDAVRTVTAADGDVRLLAGDESGGIWWNRTGVSDV